MGDFKSKLPDFKEITSIATKLYKDMKTSVTEIIDEYKHKREAAEEAAADVAKKAKEENEQDAADKKPRSTRTRKKVD